MVSCVFVGICECGGGESNGCVYIYWFLCLGFIADQSF